MRPHRDQEEPWRDQLGLTVVRNGRGEGEGGPWFPHGLLASIFGRHCLRQHRDGRKKRSTEANRACSEMPSLQIDTLKALGQTGAVLDRLGQTQADSYRLRQTGGRPVPLDSRK